MSEPMVQLVCAYASTCPEACTLGLRDLGSAGGGGWQRGEFSDLTLTMMHGWETGPLDNPRLLCSEGSTSIKTHKHSAPKAQLAQLVCTTEPSAHTVKGANKSALNVRNALAIFRCGPLVTRELSSTTLFRPIFSCNWAAWSSSTTLSPHTRSSSTCFTTPCPHHARGRKTQNIYAPRRPKHLGYVGVVATGECDSYASPKA